MSDQTGGFRPTPGSVRIRAETPAPDSIRAEVLQENGEWLPLRLCAVDIRMRGDELVTALIEVEPSSVDVSAWPERKAAEQPAPLTGEQIASAFVAQLDTVKRAVLGSNGTRADALEIMP